MKLKKADKEFILRGKILNIIDGETQAILESSVVDTIARKIAKLVIKEIKK